MPRKLNHAPDLRPTICIPLREDEIIGVTQPESVYVRDERIAQGNKWVRVPQPAQVELANGSFVPIPNTAAEPVQARHVISEVLNHMKSTVINPGP